MRRCRSTTTTSYVLHRQHSFKTAVLYFVPIPYQILSTRIALALIAATIIAVSGDAAKAQDIYVVTTVPQIRDLVEIIGGPKVQVTSLTASITEIDSLAAPRPAHIKELANANLIFFLGGSHEAAYRTILRELETNDISHSLDTLLPPQRYIPEVQSGRSNEVAPLQFNVYLWNSPTRWAEVAKRIADILSDYDHGNSKGYTARLEQYRSQLKRLAAKSAALFKPLPLKKRTIVSDPEALGYLAVEHDLSIIPLQFEQSDKQGKLKITDLFFTDRKSQPTAILGDIHASIEQRERLATVLQKYGVSTKPKFQLYLYSLASTKGEKKSVIQAYEENVRILLGSMTN